MAIADITPEEFPEVDLTNGSVLIIDDDAAIRRSLREYLADGDLFTRFAEASNGIEGFKVLANEHEHLDLVICDVEMPEFDGFKFLQMHSARKDFAATPVIILTSRSEAEHRVRGLELGAADYLVKPVIKEELRLRCRHQMMLKRMAAALRGAIRELSRLSKTDPLTGLANRRHFVEVVEAEFRRAERYGSSLSLLVMDIDNFKSINDTYGHLVGDRVIKEVAGILGYSLRQSDLAARYGGEEFAVLLPQTDLAGATLVAERYRREVEKHTFKTDRAEFHVTLSIGVGAIPELGAVNVTDLIRRSDDALYQAKQAGKNRVVQAV